MKNVEYAIVDIETTGGNAGGSRITEIAVLIHDGTRITNRWETLVNPQKDIPLPIFALTGITNEMVSRAPVFDDIAQKLTELLTNRVFVAHNVNFDYSFIKHQLEQAGFQWTARKLCTVRAARKIRPGLSSYSLGNLCRSLDIPIERRHRAGGDADATAILFSRLLDWDQEGTIEKMLKKSSQDYRLPPNLPQGDFDRLPAQPGVYYFYDRYKKVVYVGKAINIKKRVASHFTGHNINPQRQHFLRDIHGISFEICATELMALLLECAEIRRLWPRHNRALKKFEPKFGLFSYEARSGHRYLAVGKLARFQNCLHPFGSQTEAIAALRKMAVDFDIDSRFCQYVGAIHRDFFTVKNPDALPDAHIHNERVENAVRSLMDTRETFAILDKGRSGDERSCIYIENGDFHGMGYIPAEAGISDVSQLRDYVTPYRSTQYALQLVKAFAEKQPHKVLRNNGLQPGRNH